MPSVEFGYSWSERLAQGNHRREGLLDFYRENTADNLTSQDPSPVEILNQNILGERARLLQVLVPLFLTSLLGGAALACSSESFAKKARAEVLRNLGDELQPANSVKLTEAVGEIAGVQIASSESGEPAGNVADFGLPVPKDPDISVVQGWKYEGYRDGQLHGAIDYILGTDLSDASNWGSFPVLAPAAGWVCQYEFNSRYGKNYAAKMIHDNDWESLYFHLAADSRKARGVVLPSCNVPQDSWLHIERGQKFADAADSGTEPGWNHLHFMVYTPEHVLVDPYDIYGERGLYPNSDLTNGKFCGPRALFAVEVCPRSVADISIGAATLERPRATATVQATPTQEIPTVQTNEDLAHIDLNTVFDSREREKIIAAKSLEAQNLSRTFINLLMAGDNASLQQAYAMEIPESLRTSRYSDYELGNFDATYTPFNQIQICSRQMDLGEFQRYSFSEFKSSAQANLTQTQILNIQRGFAPRDRYWVGVDFTFRRYDTSLGRLGFGDFRALYDGTYLIFEDVGGRLYVAKNLLCFNRPIIYKVAQDPWHD